MTSTTSHSHITTPAAARSFWFLGGRTTLLATGEDTDGRCCVIEHELAPGAATPAHLQDDDETFVVLEGELELWVDGDLRRAGAGQSITVPRRTPHAFRVVSPEGARAVAVGAPAGHEKFFAAAGHPVAEHPEPPAGVDVERMGAAAAAAGVQLLGPPPFAAS